MRPPSRRSAALLSLAALVAVAGLASPAPSAADDRQPVPPRIFFPEPDSPSTAEITALVDGSFADVNKAPAARETLVRRYGLWSVPILLERVEKEGNVTVVWNAILTLGSLRRTLGPSQHLWPAVRTLTRVISTGGEPYRRAFAALALGEFYGPDLVRVGPSSREGTDEGFRATKDALAKGEDALKELLFDPDAATQTAATLALGKIGGIDAASRLREFLSGKGVRAPSTAHWEPRVARLLATGLLQGDDEGAFVAAVRDTDTRLRIGGALAVALWAVGQTHGEGMELPSRAATRASEYESVLDPVRNTTLGSGRDGAEAAFARGSLVPLDRRSAEVVWPALFAAATTPSTEPVTAIAATQALLFAPPQSAARHQLAELVGRRASGLQREAAVVAGFLMIAGSDGTPTGVRSCREFLGNRGRDPRGSRTWDVRFHAIVGLCRALEAGRVDRAARADVIDALVDARASLLPAEPGARSFRSVFDEVLPRSVLDALRADPDAPFPGGGRVSQRLAASFVDADVMVADDAIDVVLDRLNDQVWLLFGLDGVKAAAGPAAAGGRQPNKEDEPQRFLMAWLTREPYFTRVDLHRERGAWPSPPATTRDGTNVIDNR